MIAFALRSRPGHRVDRGSHRRRSLQDPLKARPPAARWRIARSRRSASTLWASKSAPIPYAATVVELLVGLGCLGALQLGRPTRERLVAIGLVFQASLACVVATIDAHEVPAGLDEPASLISWNCANILLVPMLSPVRSRNVLAITGVLACATPLALLVLPRIAGVSESTPVVFWSMTIPPFLCAAIAYFPSTVLEGLHREIAQARRLGAYDLVELIGAGGMGEVWRATHRLLARPAAIKLVRTEIVAAAGERKAQALARFEREAKVTAALESPHTVELYDFGIADDGTLYYVMELLCGLDLALLVERFGPLPPERVVYLLVQICDSLEEAHRAGLIHRDIKPANVFVSRRADHFDWIKVLDFGLVRPSEAMARDKDAVATTAAGQITGTPAFLAPEAALGESELDGRADEPLATGPRRRRPWPRAFARFTSTSPGPKSAPLTSGTSTCPSTSTRERVPYWSVSSRPLPGSTSAPPWIHREVLALRDASSPPRQPP